jgi:hypothetical protein
MIEQVNSSQISDFLEKSEILKVADLSSGRLTPLRRILPPRLLRRFQR